MTLHGTLDTFDLTDVLELLAASTKTGRLRVQGDKGRGTVWVRDGRVAAASTDRVRDTPLDEVLCDLLRHQTGSFAFDVDERSPQLDAPESMHDLLDRAHALLAEWRELEATVPSVDHHLALAGARPNGEAVTITARQWPVLVAIGDGCTITELPTTLGLTELQTLRAVKDLVTARLITVAASSPAHQGTRRVGPSPTHRSPDIPSPAP